MRRPDFRTFLSLLESQRSKATNARHAEMLDVLIEHCVAEVLEADLDRTMETVADDGVYHYWGGADAGPRQSGVRTANKTQQRGLYEIMLSGGPLTHKLSIDVERFFINDDAICWDGMVNMYATGTDLLAQGRKLPAGGRPEDEYVTRSRCAIFISFKDKKLVGEDYYFDSDLEVFKIEN
jgi:hypothetical protein